MNEHGGYPAGNKTADQLRPPPRGPAILDLLYREKYRLDDEIYKCLYGTLYDDLVQARHDVQDEIDAIEGGRSDE